MIALLYPLSTFVLTDDWSEHKARPGYTGNPGLDLAAPAGTPIYGSQFNGIVIEAGAKGDYGLQVLVEYRDTAEGKPAVRVRNAHMAEIRVKVGDKVEPATIIGTVGASGRATGAHTHFEVWLPDGVKWRNVDPHAPESGVRLLHRSAAGLQPIGGESGGAYAPPVEDYTKDLPAIVLLRVTPAEWVTWGVMVRANPDIGGQAIGKINPGEVWRLAWILRREDGDVWGAVLHGEKIGWAAIRYRGQELLKVMPP